MAQTERQRRASKAVAAWLSKHERNNAWLARQTELDLGTIGDFLNGLRWPKPKTRGRIEKALDWAAGTLLEIADGGPIPRQDGTVGGEGQGAAQAFVASVGERVDNGVSNEDLLREILRSRSASDRLEARQDELARALAALSERVEDIEERRS